jgi:hypothetical protein
MQTPQYDMPLSYPAFAEEENTQWKAVPPTEIFEDCWLGVFTK